ncbi:hypothetical protein QYF61_017506 [Mycteria americana]|uniref:Uncharacterized protein n=1 Tax=Mycteria americana TaxID=33587 RepID=A0AAN7NST5_MYCAM|nr:hypothetical protein QYF61_017506 [Mycteria americana]
MQYCRCSQAGYDLGPICQDGCSGQEKHYVRLLGTNTGLISQCFVGHQTTRSSPMLPIQVHLTYISFGSLVYLFIVLMFFRGAAFGHSGCSGLLILNTPGSKTLMVDLGFLLMFSARGCSLCTRASSLKGEDSSHSPPAPAWGPSHSRQFSMTFSSMSPSHGLQFFTNCSNVGPFHGVQSFRNRVLQRGFPTRSQVLPTNLLQHGLLSPWVHRSCQEPAPAWASQGVTASESQNHIGWKRPLRSSSPTINLTLPRPPLHHVSKHLIQTSFKYLQGWRLNHFPGQPVPMLDNSLGEEKFPNIQSKPPLAQLEAISSCPITCYLGEETDPHLSTTSFQAKQSQLPQPLLIRLLLQTLHQLRCPSLHMLQYLNVSLVVGGPKLNTGFEGPKLNTGFEVWPHQCRVQGHDHFPSPAGHTISDTSQDAIGFLGHLGTLPAHVQPVVNQHPQVLFHRAASQPLFPKPVALQGVVVTQVQEPALGLVEPHTIDLGPSMQPVQIPLQSLPPLQQINTSTQFGVICKLSEGALDPLVQIIDKDVKQNWPQN